MYTILRIPFYHDSIFNFDLSGIVSGVVAMLSDVVIWAKEYHCFPQVSIERGGFTTFSSRSPFTIMSVQEHFSLHEFRPKSCISYSKVLHHGCSPKESGGEWGVPIYLRIHWGPTFEWARMDICEENYKSGRTWKEHRTVVHTSEMPRMSLSCCTLAFLSSLSHSSNFALCRLIDPSNSATTACLSSRSLVIAASTAVWRSSPSRSSDLFNRAVSYLRSFCSWRRDLFNRTVSSFNRAVSSLWLEFNRIRSSCSWRSTLFNRAVSAFWSRMSFRRPLNKSTRSSMSASSVTVSVFEYPKLARKRETGRNHTFVGVMDEPNEFRGLLFSSFKQHCHDGLTRSKSDPSSIDWGACSPFQVVWVGKSFVVLC